MAHYVISVVLLLMIRSNQQVVCNLMTRSSILVVWKVLSRFPLLGFFNPATRFLVLVDLLYSNSFMFDGYLFEIDSFSPSGCLLLA